MSSLWCHTLYQYQHAVGQKECGMGGGGSREKQTCIHELLEEDKEPQKNSYEDSYNLRFNLVQKPGGRFARTLDAKCTHKPTYS